MQKRLKRCVLSVAALAALSALAETVVVPPNDVQTVRADADAVLTDAYYLRGTLQKLGSGKLTIPAERLYGTGRILVSEGALEITATGSDTDPIASCPLAEGAALWFDAKQHVETDSAGVRRWFDVRETNWQQASFQTNYIYGLAMTNLATNALSPQLIATNDCPYLYFGGGGSGQWMRWNKPDGTDAWIPVIHSFVVLNPLGTHTHYLGSSRNEDGYNCVFAVSAGAQGTTYFCNNYNSPAIYNKVRCGGVWCDGIAVDPSATIDTSVPQVLETAACSRNGYGLIPSADCFFNFRNYQQSAGSYSAGDRVGGTGIHEAIVFTNALTETERVTVEQYLVRKWVKKGSFAACTPKVFVSKGATVTIAPAVAAQISVVNDGCRVVSADEDVLASDPVAGPFGVLSVGLGAFTNRAGFVVRSEPGRAYDVDALQTVTVAAGAAGAFAKTGAGALAVDGLAEATAVTLAGETRLAVPTDSFATPAALTNNCVRDGGFEGIISPRTDYVDYAKGASFGAWVSDSHYASSATRVMYKTSWQHLDNTNCVPEGDYYMLLKWGGAAKQTVSLPADGRYAITLRCTPRTKSCAYARVSIDGFAVGTVQSRNGEPEWDMARLVTPALAKGEHVLSLSHDANCDRAIGIDDIRMTWLEPAEEQPVPNGNFEDVVWRSQSTDDPSTADSHSAIQNTYFATADSSPSFATLITNWTVTGRAYFIRRQPYLRCAAGVTGTSWYGPANDNGCCSVALQAEKNSSKADSDGIGGKITQIVKIEEDGWYRLSAKACQHDLKYDNFTLSGKTFDFGTLVLGLGDKTETFTLKGHALLARCEMAESVYFAKGALATISLKVGDVTTEGAVDTIAVDDIRLERWTYGNLLANPSFEVRTNSSGKQAPGWTVDANAADKQIFYKADDLFSISFSSREVVDGTGYLRICSYQGKANTVSQSVTVCEPGVYRLGFWSSRRVDRGRPNGIPCSFDVSVLQGETVAFTKRITPAEIDRYVRREYRMRLPAAGTYKVEFAAVLGDGTEDVSSMVDAVFFGRVAEDGSADYGISEAAEVALADGATLALDYAGTNVVRRVRSNGRVKTGLVSAETCPDAILGTGALATKHFGLIIIVK